MDGLLYDAVVEVVVDAIHWMGWYLSPVYTIVLRLNPPFPPSLYLLNSSVEYFQCRRGILVVLLLFIRAVVGGKFTRTPL